jgi:hypothetical protein
MDWIELDQYSDRWQAFVYGVMNVQVKLHGRISLLPSNGLANE